MDERPLAVMSTRPLLRDGALTLSLDEGIVSAIEPWAPAFTDAAAPPSLSSRIAITVERRLAPPHDQLTRPASADFTMSGVAAHVASDGAAVALYAHDDSCGGRVHLAHGRAELWTTVGEGERCPPLRSMLTIAAGLLMGRLHGALVHAAALVDPDGEGWLLVGDRWSGKSTTCASLVAAGWNYLADDQIVLRPDPTATRIVAEGWPRQFNLDDGWELGVVRGRRRPRGQFMATSRQETAALRGLLFPFVEPAAPTALLSTTAGDALTKLIRQSPWLLYDRAAAPAVLALFRDAAQLPTYGLRLGLDSYARGDVLAALLHDVTTTSRSA
ncbi:MAG: hypothetical protein NVS1B4_21600 [Gemmatimonadaceae bacterium]